jgi:hypothetical protein
LCENQLLAIDFHIFAESATLAIIPSIGLGLCDWVGERLALIRLLTSGQANQLTDVLRTGYACPSQFGTRALKPVIKPTMVGVAAGALMIISRHFGRAHGTDQNAYPIPTDHSEARASGCSIAARRTTAPIRMIAPIQTFDAAGNFVRTFGADMFNSPHGLYVDTKGARLGTAPTTAGL